MRWPWRRKEAAPLMPVWLAHAHYHALLVATIAEQLRQHPALVGDMRADLLARARQLVEVLKAPSVPSMGDNVLPFERKAS